MNPEDVSNTIIDGCNGAERIIRTAMANAPGVVSYTINHHPLTFLLPGFVKSRIIDLILSALRKAADLLLQATNTLRTLAKSLGRPTDLRAAAQTLSDKVAGGSKTLSGSMTRSKLQGLDTDNWQSLATVPYSTGLTEQASSVDKIGEISRNLEETLRHMADAIETFYGDLRLAYIGFGLAVAGLVVVIATWETGVGAIIGLVVAILGVIVGLVSVVVVFTGVATENSQRAEEMAASPSLSWTKSVFAA